MKSSEHQEAVKCYSRSIELNSTEAATFSNRAMAYLKLKDFSKAIEDSNSALAIKPDYLKAYHRRGKAYASVNKLDLAIKDFQYILEVEPENKEAINELKNARKKLMDKQKPLKEQKQPLAPAANVEPTLQATLEVKKEEPKSAPVQEKFVRVAISEDSSDEEAEVEEIKIKPKDSHPS